MAPNRACRSAATPPPGGVRIFALVLAAALGGCTKPEPKPLAPMACGDAATPIAAVQGPGARSALAGTEVEIEGVVSAVFRAGLGAIVVETPAAQRDADPATSDALFVVLEGARTRRVTMPSRVRPGVRVRVRGRVGELGDRDSTLTVLEQLSDLTTCSATLEPIPETALAARPPDWERLEGMRVQIAAGLTITGTGELPYVGALDASFAGRLFAETELARPGPEAEALQRTNEAAMIRLDDGFGDEPVLAPWYLRGIGPETPWRVGTTLGAVRGIVDERGGRYRVQLLEPLTALEQAPRPAAPPDVGGDLRVGAFNVLNFFNGDGAGGGFPTPRGATDPVELERQLAKIVAAITTLAPDVAALMEIENDDTGPGSAIVRLVDALNAALGADGDYRIAGPEIRTLGTDLIRVALIYRERRVRPVGAAAKLDTGPFAEGSRAPIAQAFVAPGGTPFTVVAIHFKSKGFCPADGPNVSRHDGQGCWNPARVAAAQALHDWLATDPTGAGAHGVLLVGDFNAHWNEDPLHLLRGLGWVDVIETRHRPGDARPYSYVFAGRSARLDHGLVSAPLAARVTGAAEWHINTDELEQLDYNVEGKSARQREAWYRPDPFRSSDHDPLVVGIRAR